MALAMWSMTTLIAPVAGPLLGGWITDNYSWPWIFYINVPVGLLAVYVTWGIFRDRESPTQKLPIDKVGLILMVLWIAAVQIMLDKGKELDWFASREIVALAVVAVVAFVFFLIWELTERYPIVDLTLFAGRNFAMGAVTLAVAYGALLRQRRHPAAVAADADGLYGDRCRLRAGAGRLSRDPAVAGGRPGHLEGRSALPRLDRRSCCSR